MGHDVLVEGGQAVLAFPEGLHAQHVPSGGSLDEVELEVEELLPIAGLQLHAVAEQVHVVGDVVPPRPAVVPEIEADAVGRDVAVELIAVDDLEGHAEIIQGVVDDLGHLAGHGVGDGVPEERDGHRLARSVVVGQVGHGDRVALHLPSGQAHRRHRAQVENGPVGHRLEVVAPTEADMRAERGLASLEPLAARSRPTQRGAMVETRGSAGLVVDLLGAIGSIEMVIDQQVVPIRVEGGWLVVHPLGDGRSVEGLAPDSEIVDPAVVVVGPGAAAPEVHPDDALDGVVLVGAAVEQDAVEVHLHHARRRILDEGPMVPLPFVIGGCGLSIDAVITAVPPAVPIDAAVAPGQVDVDHPLVVGVEALEQRAVLGLALGVAIDPALNGDFVGQSTEVRHVHCDAVRGGEVHLSTLVSRRPPLALGVSHSHPTILGTVGGHLDIVQGEFEDEIALPVPLDGGLKAKREAVCELPGRQPVLIGRVGQVQETGQGRVPRQPPLEVQPPGVGGAGQDRDEEAINRPSTEGGQFLCRPEKLGALGGGRSEQVIRVVHRPRLDDGLRIDHVHDVLRCGDPNGILHAVHIGNEVGRLERRIGEEAERVLQGGAVQQARVVEEVGVAQVVPLAAGIA